ncbi:MAG TPA: urease accessory protein UreD [Acidimicrobiales bacterium]
MTTDARAVGVQPPGIACAKRSELTGSVLVEVVKHGRGRSAVSNMRASGVLGIRDTPWGLWIVGTGAQPIGGDRLSVELDLGPGSTMFVRSVGASVARAGPRQGVESVAAVDARVAAGATLVWAPEPGIAAQGARHRSCGRVALAATSRLAWLDEVVLGRASEGPGTWVTSMRIERAGRAELAFELGSGPGARGWGAPSVLDGRPVAVTLVVVDPDRSLPPDASDMIEEVDAVGTILPSASGSAVQLGVWGETLGSCRRVASDLLARFGPPHWLPEIWP